MSISTFKMDRAVFKHRFFADEPFTEREAWVWMISAAVFADCRVRANSKPVNLKRGQLTYSIRFLAQQWQWHRSRVERFLNRLKTERMIETDRETGQIIITICNYDKYQLIPGYGETSETPSETPSEIPSETPSDAGQNAITICNYDKYQPVPRDTETASETPSQTASETASETNKNIIYNNTIYNNGEDIRANKPNPVSEMVEEWNSLAAECGLGSVQRITDKRKRSAPLRLTEIGGMDGWRACLDKIRGSQFLRGQTTKWRVTFDWLMSPSNLTKLMEGNYDDRFENAEQKQSSRRRAMLEAAGKLADGGPDSPAGDQQARDTSGSRGAGAIESPGDDGGVIGCAGSAV
jgi:hypothetical protein